VGSRGVLARIVVWWSAFTMFTGAVFNFPALLGVRFLFGAGEAGAWPNAARVFSRWIPRRERWRVQGIFFAGAHLAGGLTPPLVVWIATLLPWRLVFVALGMGASLPHAEPRAPVSCSTWPTLTASTSSLPGCPAIS